jgi:hypothetical protein
MSYAFWIPASVAQFASCWLLKKDKAKSTAFLVAQIFVSDRAGNTCAQRSCIPKLQKTRIGNSRASQYRTVSSILARRRGAAMKGRGAAVKDREKWMELCRQASVEQDPRKLLELTAEIIRLLDDKEDRLIHRAAKPEADLTPQL